MNKGEVSSMSSLALRMNPRRRPAPFAVLLGLVMALFMGILIFAYVAAKQANPVMLDEHGKAITQSQPSGER